MNTDIEIDMDVMVDEYMRYGNGITSNVNYPVAGKKKHRISYEWHNNGIMCMRESYHRKKESGVFCQYYKNGQLKSIEVYKKGEVIVPFQMWTKNGN
jgi:antitoxin component YwqK of YwqJK toxin-antitoxin module